METEASDISHSSAQHPSTVQLSVDGQSPLSLPICIIGMAWLLLPAFQYFCTFQRTSLQINGYAFAPGLARIDLTPGYYVLVVFSLVAVLLLRTVRRGVA